LCQFLLSDAAVLADNDPETLSPQVANPNTWQKIKDRMTEKLGLPPYFVTVRKKEYWGKFVETAINLLAALKEAADLPYNKREGRIPSIIKKYHLNESMSARFSAWVKRLTERDWLVRDETGYSPQDGFSYAAVNFVCSMPTDYCPEFADMRAEFDIVGEVAVASGIAMNNKLREELATATDYLKIIVSGEEGTETIYDMLQDELIKGNVRPILLLLKWCGNIAELDEHPDEQGRAREFLQYFTRNYLRTHKDILEAFANFVFDKAGASQDMAVGHEGDSSVKVAIMLTGAEQLGNYLKAKAQTSRRKIIFRDLLLTMSMARSLEHEYDVDRIVLPQHSKEILRKYLSENGILTDETRHIVFVDTGFKGSVNEFLFRDLRDRRIREDFLLLGQFCAPWEEYLGSGLNKQNGWQGDEERLRRFIFIMDDGFEASTTSPVRFHDGTKVTTEPTPRLWFYGMVKEEIGKLAESRFEGGSMSLVDLERLVQKCVADGNIAELVTYVGKYGQVEEIRGYLAPHPKEIAEFERLLSQAAAERPTPNEMSQLRIEVMNGVANANVRMELTKLHTKQDINNFMTIHNLADGQEELAKKMMRDDFRKRFGARYPTLCKYLEYYYNRLVVHRRNYAPVDGVELMLLGAFTVSYSNSNFTPEVVDAFDKFLPRYNKLRREAIIAECLPKLTNTLYERYHISTVIYDLRDAELIRLYIQKMEEMLSDAGNDISTGGPARAAEGEAPASQDRPVITVSGLGKVITDLVLSEGYPPNAITIEGLVEYFDWRKPEVFKDVTGKKEKELRICFAILDNTEERLLADKVTNKRHYLSAYVPDNREKLERRLKSCEDLLNIAKKTIDESRDTIMPPGSRRARFILQFFEEGLDKERETIAADERIGFLKLPEFFEEATHPERREFVGQWQRDHAELLTYMSARELWDEFKRLYHFVSSGYKNLLTESVAEVRNDTIQSHVKYYAWRHEPNMIGKEVILENKESLFARIALENIYKEWMFRHWGPDPTGNSVRSIPRRIEPSFDQVLAAMSPRLIDATGAPLRREDRPIYKILTETTEEEILRILGLEDMRRRLAELETTGVEDGKGGGRPGGTPPPAEDASTRGVPLGNVPEAAETVPEAVPQEVIVARIQRIEALLSRISEQDLSAEELSQASSALSEAVKAIHPDIDVNLDMNKQEGTIRMMVDGKPYETYSVSTPTWCRKNGIIFSRSGMGGEYMTAIPTGIAYELSMIISTLALDAKRITTTPIENKDRVMVQIRFFGTGSTPQIITAMPRISDTKTLAAILTVGIALTNADLLYKWHYEQMPEDVSPAHPADVFLARLDGHSRDEEAIAALKTMLQQDADVVQYLLKDIPCARLPRTVKNAGLPALAKVLLDYFTDNEKWRAPTSWLEHIAPHIRSDPDRFGFESYVMSLFDKTPLIPTEAISAIRSLIEREKKEWSRPDGENPLSLAVDNFFTVLSNKLPVETKRRSQALKVLQEMYQDEGLPRQIRDYAFTVWTTNAIRTSASSPAQSPSTSQTVPQEATDSWLDRDRLTLARHLTRVGITPGQRAMDIGPGANSLAGEVLTEHGCEVDVVEPNKADPKDLRDYMKGLETDIRRFYKDDAEAIRSAMARVHPHESTLGEFLSDNPQARYSCVVAINVLDILVREEVFQEDMRRFWESLADNAVMIISMYGNSIDKLRESAGQAGLSLEIEVTPEDYCLLKGDYNYTIRVRRLPDEGTPPDASQTAQNDTTLRIWKDEQKEYLKANRRRDFEVQISPPLRTLESALETARKAAPEIEEFFRRFKHTLPTVSIIQIYGELCGTIELELDLVAISEDLRQISDLLGNYTEKAARSSRERTVIGWVANHKDLFKKEHQPAIMGVVSAIDDFFVPLIAFRKETERRLAVIEELAEIPDRGPELPNVYLTDRIYKNLENVVHLFNITIWAYGGNADKLGDTFELLEKTKNRIKDVARLIDDFVQKSYDDRDLPSLIEREYNDAYALFSKLKDVLQQSRIQKGTDDPLGRLILQFMGYCRGNIDSVELDSLLLSVKEDVAKLAVSAAAEAWPNAKLDPAKLLTDMETILELDKGTLKEDKSAFIFSKKAAFDNGLAVLLPKLAEAGIKVAVVAGTKEQKAMIDRLNEGKEKRIICGFSIEEIKSSMPSDLYYYLKVNGESPSPLSQVITRDITDFVKRIIDIIGNACGIAAREKLEFLYGLARKFAEAA
jgi:hypothetical protein